MKTNTVPPQYWDEGMERWDSRSAFNTVAHEHIGHYGSDGFCDLLIVECADGRWYIEDSWGGDANGAGDVFNPFEKESFPKFFGSYEEAKHRAAEIISKATGKPLERLLKD